MAQEELDDDLLGLDLGCQSAQARFIFVCRRADSQLLYASDWPNWDFDAPSSITKLPFLEEQAKRNILGLTAAKLFNLEVPPAKSGKKMPTQQPVAVPAE